MTYKWEAMVEDLTVEGDRLLKAIQWLEENSTLHQSVEILYVVDGYQVTIMHENGVAELSPRFEGYDLLSAIDAARSALKETT